MNNLDRLTEVVRKECSNCKVADMFSTGSHSEPDKHFAVIRESKKYEWTVDIAKIIAAGFRVTTIGSYNGKDELYVRVINE